MFRFLLTLLFLAVSVVGCGPGGPPTAPVDGIVTFEDTPVAHAVITFFPQNVKDGQTAYAQTDAEGKFSNALTGGKIDGAVVGSHFVTITEGWPPGQEVPIDASGMERSPPRGQWAQKYRDSTDPVIKVEVVADKDNHFEWDISK